MRTTKELIEKYRSHIKNLKWCINMNSGYPIVEMSKLQLAAYNEILNDLEQCEPEIPSDPKNIMDRVKTYEDACAVLKLQTDPISFAYLRKDEIAYIKLKRIVKALNEGWTPNWDDKYANKYTVWFYLNTPFRFGLVSHSDVFLTIGSRLCFKTEWLAEYAATQFVDIYKDFLT